MVWKDEMATKKQAAKGKRSGEEPDGGRGKEQLPGSDDWPGPGGPLPLEGEQNDEERAKQLRGNGRGVVVAPT